MPEYSLGRAQLIEQKAAAARAEREAALEKERKAVVERMRMRKALEESQAELGANPVDYAFTDIAPADSQAPFTVTFPAALTVIAPDVIGDPVNDTAA